MKRIEKGTTNHTPAKTDDDMVNISQLVPDDSLRHHFFYSICVGVVRKNNVELKFDGDCNKEFIQLRDSKIKIHYVFDGQRSSEARLYAEDGELCPVAMIRCYISKLNKECIYLW